MSNKKNNMSLIPQKYNNIYPQLTKFNYQFGINKLVILAQPIFLIITRLKKNYASNSNNKFHDTLLNELNIFAVAAHKQKYAGQIIDIAKSSLLYTLTNIATNINLLESLHLKTDALTYSQKDYFAKLDLLISDPNTQIDLLEFVYTCLRLSQNLTHISTPSQQQQEYVTKIYIIIKQQKGNISKNLFIHPKNILSKKNVFTLSILKLFFGWMFLITIAFVGVYFTTDLNLAAMNTQLKVSLEHLLNNGEE